MSTDLPVLKSQFFRALAHPTRIRILEQLARGERTVRELQHDLGLGQPVVSQQLAALRGRDLVTVRRAGVQAHYALRSPLIAELLRVARAFLTHALGDHRALLRQLQRERRSVG